MREVDYIVMASPLFPDEIIYAGTIKKLRNGKGRWVTRKDVTDMVIQSFLDYFVEKSKKLNPSGRGMEYSFKSPEDDYVITLKIKKKGKE